jgi:CubicO group peptidase (beta-lactamase class C family)
MSLSKIEGIRAGVERLLQAGVSGNVFPGASCALSWRAPPLRGSKGRPAAAGRVEAAAGLREPGGKPATPDTLFDLASLTKPIVATVALRLVARGALSLGARLEEFFPDARGTLGGQASLEQLLTHRSGLAAWGGLYLDVPHERGTVAAQRWMIGEAARRVDETPRPADEGVRAVYSDLGYLLAGELIARSAGHDLATLVRREIVEPLGLDPRELAYAAALPPERLADLVRSVAATERDEWRGYLLRGEVHDENCAAFGGVSAHAGLFGTARAVAGFGRAVLDAYLGASDGFLPQELVTAALAPRPGGTNRLGFDGKSPGESAAGKRTSAETFGHLGFTGTSLFCDPVHDVVVVLLSNRVCPSRANQKIKFFRPALHDGVMGLIAP